MNTTKLPVLVNELCHWLRDQIVAEVPADLAVCEFECRKTECFSDEWVAVNGDSREKLENICLWSVNEKALTRAAKPKANL